MLTQEQIDFILSLPYDEVSYAELGEMLEGEFPNPQEFDEACEIFDGVWFWTNGRIWRSTNYDLIND